MFVDSSMAALAAPEVPKALGASAGIVDVVSCRLAAAPGGIRDLRRLLSATELARAYRCRTGCLRDAFIVGRGRLRQLLGQAAGCRPAAVGLALERGGKPRLDRPAGSPLRFNVAHSAGLMLCAFATGHDVGVDVERVREDAGWEDVAERFFALPERRALAALPAAMRPSAFFACWTRKEAVIKATGEGLARPLDSFVVSAGSDHAEVLSCDPALGAPESWFLAPVPVSAGYRAAVAVRDGRGSVSVRRWSWPPLAAVRALPDMARAGREPRG